MMNPNDISDAAHLAYHEVFDGYPFPADMVATGSAGPFDLMTGASKVIFLNLMAMHYNASAGTFIDQSTLDGLGQPVMGNNISAVNASYIIVALEKFSQEFAGSLMQTTADNALIAQADFIIANFKDVVNGGYYNNYVVGTGASTSAKTVDANAAIIRGLYATYSATNNTSYLTEANNAYNYLINNYYNPTLHTYKTELGIRLLIHLGISL